MEELLLSDSDDEVVFGDPSGRQKPAKTTNSRDKGKGRVVPSFPQRQPAASNVLDLVDSPDESFSAPGPSRHRTHERRTPSPAILLPPLPVLPTSPLSQVLAIIPDVLPSHATALLGSTELAGNVEAVVDTLLSSKNYPKVEIEGEKEKKKEPEKDWIDVAKRKREGEQPSVLYKRIAYVSFPLLQLSFPQI
jgi:hypothetical protein